MSRRSRLTATLRVIGLALLALAAVYAIGRAIVEVIMLDPNAPASYQQDWGGPHYLGVMLVHAGPGLLAVILTVLWLRRVMRRTRLRRTLT